MPNAGHQAVLGTPNHGIFSQVVADGLKGKADPFGYEPDGLITVEELIKYVSKRVARSGPGQRQDRRGKGPAAADPRRATPAISSWSAIRPSPASTRNASTQFEKIAKTNRLPKVRCRGGHNYLSRMPKLEAQQELRKAYQKLADGKMTADQFRRNAKRSWPARSCRTKRRPYARKVMGAAEIVMHYYFKKLTPPQLVEAAVRGMYKHLDEPVPSNIKEKLDNIKNLEKADLLTLLTDARLHLGKREDLANGKDVTLSLHAMMGKLDRHSDYIDPETLARFKIELQGKFSGIGVQIRKNNTRDQLQVITPIIGSPAYKAKIYAGDIITHIVREVDNEGRPAARARRPSPPRA